VRGIIAFRLTIRRLEGKWKMRQNRPLADRLGMAQGLEAEGKSDVAALMRPVPQNAEAVRRVVREAYARWIPVIGRAPTPMQC
jgi:hypothetical protein